MKHNPIFLSVLSSLVLVVSSANLCAEREVEKGSEYDTPIFSKSVCSDASLLGTSLRFRVPGLGSATINVCVFNADGEELNVYMNTDCISCDLDTFVLIEDSYCDGKHYSTLPPKHYQYKYENPIGQEAKLNVEFLSPAWTPFYAAYDIDDSPTSVTAPVLIVIGAFILITVIIVVLGQLGVILKIKSKFV